MEWDLSLSFSGPNSEEKALAMVKIQWKNISPGYIRDNSTDWKGGNKQEVEKNMKPGVVMDLLHILNRHGTEKGDRKQYYILKMTVAVSI